MATDREIEKWKDSDRRKRERIRKKKIADRIKKERNDEVHAKRACNLS